MAASCVFSHYQRQPLPSSTIGVFPVYICTLEGQGIERGSGRLHILGCFAVDQQAALHPRLSKGAMLSSREKFPQIQRFLATTQWKWRSSFCRYPIKTPPLPQILPGGARSWSHGSRKCQCICLGVPDAGSRDIGIMLSALIESDQWPSIHTYLYRLDNCVTY